MTVLEIAAWIGTPMAGLFLIACRLDAVLAADAKRREAESAEFVMWVEEGPA